MFTTKRELGKIRRNSGDFLPKRSNRRRITDEEKAERQRQMEESARRLAATMAKSFGW